MRTGNYTLRELFCNRHIEQIVIPEIQRDYVWPTTHAKHLLKSILSNFADWNRGQSSPGWKLELPDSQSQTRQQALEDDFAAFYARRNFSTNVGFIYAYSDAELPSQFFLIDGQQRLTTLYLTLLAIAASDPVLTERFRSNYCLRNSKQSPQSVLPTKIDYRLREHTSDFLKFFVHHVLENKGQASDLKEQVWFVRHHVNDTTAQNIEANYKEIHQQVSSQIQEAGSAIPLFNYLENLVECWYFDTNQSAQGEELYLYLNARGEALAENENLKADMLGQIQDPSAKHAWGRKWEAWQDFFWNHRSKGRQAGKGNPNADVGFNAFLECIAGLENLKDEESQNTGLHSLSLETIERYIEGLQWLTASKDTFKALHAEGAANWVEFCIDDIWRIWNDSNKTNWAADLSDSNKSTEHNRMVLGWGVLLCSTSQKDESKDDEDQIEATFRCLRLIYLRYHNNNRAVKSLPNTISQLLHNSDFKESSNVEENIKWTFFKSIFSHKERRLFEEAIWKIEDHPLNLNGRDVGALNISHLIELDSRSTELLDLQRTSERFNELFPLDPNNASKQDPKAKQHTLRNTLLYYGSYYLRDTPYYYENYNFKDWRRIIRGINAVDGLKNTFRRFFTEFCDSDLCIADFHNMKHQGHPLGSSEVDNITDALIWYGQQLGDEMWRKGAFMAIRDNESHDDRTHNVPELWNTWGDLRGYGHWELSSIFKTLTSS